MGGGIGDKVGTSRSSFSSSTSSTSGRTLDNLLPSWLPGATSFDPNASRPARVSAAQSEPNDGSGAMNWGSPLGAVAEAAAAHPRPLSRWHVDIVSVSGSTAVVTCNGDTDSISVPVEVSGATAGARGIVDFREGGGVALTAIVQ